MLKSLWLGETRDLILHAIPPIPPLPPYETHIVELPLRVVADDLLQHPPVGPGLVLGDATAALQVELVHLLRV